MKSEMDPRTLAGILGDLNRMITNLGHYDLNYDQYNQIVNKMQWCAMELEMSDPVYKPLAESIRDEIDREIIADIMKLAETDNAFDRAKHIT